MMDKDALFAILSTQDAGTLLEVLSRAYDQMQDGERQAVFGQLMKPASHAAVEVEAESFLDEVDTFKRVSLDGLYYAPFNINSRNFMHIPDETTEWFDTLGGFLTRSVQLTSQGDHLHAAACFKILYELIDAMEEGDEIVFAHELGSWMIPVDEKECIAAYITSLAAVSTPEEFTAAALTLIRRDSLHSFANDAYTAAITAATDEQRVHLETEIRERKIRTGRTA
jgi:hypothetical protein